jgi:hypothetical protein
MVRLTERSTRTASTEARGAVRQSRQAEGLDSTGTRSTRERVGYRKPEGTRVNVATGWMPERHDWLVPVESL